MKNPLGAGSMSLIGSKVSKYFLQNGWKVFGIESNQRATFFCLSADNSANRKCTEKYGRANPLFDDVDIRDRQRILDIIPLLNPVAIVHAAARPSYDRDATITFEDFDTNALGTFNLHESLRRYFRKAHAISILGKSAHRLPYLRLFQPELHENTLFPMSNHP